jgi:RNA polymerase sigma factor (sigma-70 family)
MDTVPLAGRAARRLTDAAPDPASGPVTAVDGWPGDLVALYLERRLSLVRLAYVLTSDREVAEEVVQDAFLSVRARWDDITDPPSYLRTAVVNRCRSWLRRQRTARAHVPDRAEAATLGADELWDALARLDERRYTAIVLRFYEDLPEAEIARILECRPATVRTLVRRGLAALREEIDP